MKTWTLDTLVQWPLEISESFSVSPTSISGTAFTLVSVAKTGSCVVGGTCQQTVTFTAATTAPVTNFPLDLIFTMNCRSGETCDGYSPSNETISLILNLPDMSPTTTVDSNASDVTVAVSSHEASFIGAIEENFLPGETIYLVIALSQAEGTTVSSAVLKNGLLTVNGTGATHFFSSPLRLKSLS